MSILKANIIDVCLFGHCLALNIGVLNFYNIFYTVIIRLNHIPNFLIIGAARSGTTTLYEWLREHPNIYLPIPKRPEPHFFLKTQEYQKGFDYYVDRYFSNWEGQKAVGEVSTSYIYQSFAAHRIKNNLPDVKIIAILRHPVERAYSNYLHTVNSGLETLSFEDAIKYELERTSNPFKFLPDHVKVETNDPNFWLEVQPYAYVNRGFYFNQLEIFYKLFLKSNIFVCLFDELVQDSDSLVKKLYHFLDVDERFIPQSIYKVFNGSLNKKKYVINQEIQDQLLQIYAPENDKLKTLINFDLDKWERTIEF